MSTLFHCEFLCLILVLRQGQPRWTETPQKGTKITLSSLSIVYCRYLQRQKTNTDDSRALQLLWQMRKFRVCRNECIFSDSRTGQQLTGLKPMHLHFSPSVPFLQSLWRGLLVPLKWESTPSDYLGIAVSSCKTCHQSSYGASRAHRSPCGAKLRNFLYWSENAVLNQTRNSVRVVFTLSELPAGYKI